MTTRTAVAFLAVMLVHVASPRVVMAQEIEPKYSNADRSQCPPQGPGAKHTDEDENVSNHPDGHPDWFVERWHSDDGYYNLTVEGWCIDKGSESYFTYRIYESVNGRDRLIVPAGDWPTGAGHCCPFLDGVNIGPIFLFPPQDPKKPRVNPKRVDHISKNPHVPGDAHPKIDYEKTLFWTETNLNKVIRGQISIDTDGHATFTGEFVVGSSGLLDGSKTADRLSPDDKKELLKIVEEEIPRVDEEERRRRDAGELPPDNSPITAKKKYKKLYSFNPSLEHLVVQLQSPEAAEVNRPIRYAATLAGGLAPRSGDAFVWEFGDGSRASGNQVTHTYSKPGAYTVQVFATDHFGAMGIAKRSLRVTPSGRSDRPPSPAGRQ